jgi:DNA-binding NtrC family response regulator
MKILVVDDESIVLESCKRVLEDRFEVILDQSADAALEMPGNHRRCILLTSRASARRMSC